MSKKIEIDRDALERLADPMRRTNGDVHLARTLVDADKVNSREMGLTQFIEKHGHAPFDPDTGEAIQMANHSEEPLGVVVDLDALDWETIQKAADESNWMPNEYMRNEWVADVCNFLKYGRVDTSPTAPVAVVLPEPIPITDGMNRLMEAYRLGELQLEGGSPTIEAMSCASYDNHPTAIHDHDFDSYAAGYQAAMYEEAKSLLSHIACLDKVKELNQ